MSRRFRKQFDLRRGWVAVTAAISAALMCLATVGVPVPTDRPPKDRSQAYPCRDRACGCMSANECWRHCCCFSLEEKIAWAVQNDVVPPDEVLAEWRVRRARDAAVVDVEQVHSAQVDDKLGDAKCCCSPGGKVSPNAPGDCCKSHETEAERHADDAAACRTVSNAEYPPRVKFILGLFARKCKGIDGFWSAFAQCVMPPGSVEVSFEQTSQFLAIVESPTQGAGRERPPLPPPRFEAFRLGFTI